MEMEVTAQTDHIERKFGHHVINWKIENFCLATCNPNEFIYSPEFYIKEPLPTKWQMILCPYSKIEEAFYISFYLKRLKCEGFEIMFSNIVWANWKLWILDNKENSLYVNSFRYYFDDKSQHSVVLLKTKDVLDKIRPFDSDTLNFRSRLIVKSIDISRRIERFYIPSLKSLSQDLKELFKRSKYYDVVFVVNGGKIRAHKSILRCRSNKLANIMRQNYRKEEIELTNIDYTALKSVFSYLYSGNLDFVLTNPSIAIFECVLFLNIDEVKCYYVADEIFLHSTIPVKEFTCLWLIEDYSTRTEDFFSPVLNEGISDTIWKLHLYPKGSNYDGEYISLFADIVEGIIPKVICVEAALVDYKQEFFYPKRIRKCMEINTIGFEEFVKWNYLENSSLIADDTLNIVFKFRTSTPEWRSFHGSLMTSTITAWKKQQSYVFLSMDMEKLFKENYFADFILFADSSYIPAHKCILAARSRIFAREIEKMRDGETILIIPNIKFNILYIILRYLYCGILPEFELRNVQQIYEAADIYAIQMLKDACSQFMQDSVRVRIERQ